MWHSICLSVSEHFPFEYHISNGGIQRKLDLHFLKNDISNKYFLCGHCIVDVCVVEFSTITAAVLLQAMEPQQQEIPCAVRE